MPEEADFRKMLEGADLREFLQMADDYIPEVSLSDEKRAAFDAVGRCRAEKAIGEGKHLAAIFIVSASCVQDTILDIARQCLAAHPDTNDVERILMWRELCGLSGLLAKCSNPDE